MVLQEEEVMDKKNSVFIATSIDGYIADKEGSIDWLNSIPNPEQDDMRYMEFISRIDAIVMGRNTFETVHEFEGPWPYDKPVFVLSKTLNTVPNHLVDKVFLINGNPEEVLNHIHSQGFNRIYIDGGTTIQQFLKANLIDEMVLTTIPILLGGGSPLFGELHRPIRFKLKETRTHLGQIVQRHYVRER